MSRRARRLSGSKVGGVGVDGGRSGRKQRTGRRRARRKETWRFLTRLEKTAVEGHTRSNCQRGAGRRLGVTQTPAGPKERALYLALLESRSPE
jgi:hypothetical protein